MRWLWEVFFTLWNHSVALVCSEVSQCLFKVALQLIKYFKSNICLEMGKKFTIKSDLDCFIFQPEKFIVVTTCTDYGNTPSLPAVSSVAPHTPPTLPPAFRFLL